MRTKTQMVKNDLHPPHSGPGRNPILYGVACGLAKLFPPIEPPAKREREANAKSDGQTRTSPRID